MPTPNKSQAPKWTVGVAEYDSARDRTASFARRYAVANATVFAGIAFIGVPRLVAFAAEHFHHAPALPHGVAMTLGALSLAGIVGQSVGSLIGLRATLARRALVAKTAEAAGETNSVAALMKTARSEGADGFARLVAAKAVAMGAAGDADKATRKEARQVVASMVNEMESRAGAFGEARDSEALFQSVAGKAREQATKKKEEKAQQAAKRGRLGA
jgi:hypothetical protein